MVHCVVAGGGANRKGQLADGQAGTAGAVGGYGNCCGYNQNGIYLYSISIDLSIYLSACLSIYLSS